MPLVEGEVPELLGEIAEPVVDVERRVPLQRDPDQADPFRAGEFQQRMAVAVDFAESLLAIDGDQAATGIIGGL